MAVFIRGLTVSLTKLLRHVVQVHPYAVTLRMSGNYSSAPPPSRFQPAQILWCAVVLSNWPAHRKSIGGAPHSRRAQWDRGWNKQAQSTQHSSPQGPKPRGGLAQLEFRRAAAIVGTGAKENKTIRAIPFSSCVREGVSGWVRAQYECPPRMPFLPHASGRDYRDYARLGTSHNNPMRGCTIRALFVRGRALSAL